MVSKKDENENRVDWLALRPKLFRMVSVGVVDERVNQAYDVISTLALILNLTVSILNTFDNLREKYGAFFLAVEAITVLFFAVDYVLRLLTAPELYPNVSEKKAVVQYILSFAGIIDLLSFLPYYLPVFFPAGAATFRLFRLVRILRLFRINAYYDSLNVITEVLSRKRQQLLSSVFIIMVLMLASSLCMYSVEHEAQPEVFSNAFSGIWWAASTLLTVGYGDIYPITTLGKLMGIVIAFLGVGMVAIPTGIISAGFVEQYTRLKRLGEYGQEEDIHFIRLKLSRRDAWVGKKLYELGLPSGALVVAVLRGRETIIPRGDLVLQAEDRMIIGAEALRGEHPVEVKETILKKDHPWTGKAISDLNISRQSLIIMVRRKGHAMIPKGDTILVEGDVVYLYSKVEEETEG
ncbi:MAG: ion transporter [Lachnospiraceae bacterium]|nr:ion transporter [Lachnospiraceae bacterium]